jgi:hypothetical protein
MEFLDDWGYDPGYVGNKSTDENEKHNQPIDTDEWANDKEDYNYDY